jgi:ABC-type Mn2+/Zn2+ transport system ATPase subunit
VVLADVNLTVRQGEFWFIVGRNGSGKSTLLRAIIGTLPPSTGALRLHAELARRERMGYVPQRCELNPTLPTTVREFVLLGLVGTRTTRTDERVRLEWALSRAGLAGMARRDYWALSGGERQRALLARALVRRPSLLILDEPTTHLDPEAEEALSGLLASLNREEHLTLLVVTHDVAMADRHATHVAVVEGGTVRAGPRDTMRKVLAV